MIKICTFDLECSSLNADFGIIGCAVIKAQNTKKPVILRADELNKKWKTQRSDDSGIVRKIAEELSQYDLLIAHNGRRFDIPFLQSRMARWGMGAFPRKKIIDPVQIARWQFQLTSNNLASITNHLGIEGKTPVSGRVWLEAFLDGSKAAMDEIVRHCVADVEILERIVDAVKGYCSQFDSRGSSW